MGQASDAGQELATFVGAMLVVLVSLLRAEHLLVRELVCSRRSLLVPAERWMGPLSLLTVVMTSPGHKLNWAEQLMAP